MTNTNKKNFCELIGCRAKLGLLQKDVALLIGVATNTYSAKEKGNIVFTIDEAFTIKDEFNKRLIERGFAPTTVESLFFKA